MDADRTTILDDESQDRVRTWKIAIAIPFGVLLAGAITFPIVPREHVELKYADGTPKSYFRLAVEERFKWMRMTFIP